MKVSGKTPVKNGIDTTKPAKTFSKVWPASILAKSLTDKLIGLLRYEIISMTTIKGNKTIGTPLGTKSFK